jgi:hypothetical protein
VPLALPPSPTPGQIEPYNGKNWRWMGGYWSAVSQFAPSVEASNTFQAAVKQNYYETLVTTAPNPVANMTGVLLTYL